MESLSLLELLSFLLLLALSYGSGSNDVAKAIATLVGSGATNYRTAILWGTACCIIGASTSAFITTAMIKTFSEGLVQPGTIIPQTLTVAALIGAMAWVFLASRTGFPVSTTHALLGSVVGSCVVALSGEVMLWPSIIKNVVLPLLLSPFLGITLSFLLYPCLQLLTGRWDGSSLYILPVSQASLALDAQSGTKILFQTSIFGYLVLTVPPQCDRSKFQGMVSVGLDTVHWVSSGLASFARGASDVPKIAALLLLNTMTLTWPSLLHQIIAFGAVTLAMAAGSYIGGLRVTIVLARTVKKMSHMEGLAANLATSSLLLCSSTLGFPVSTTHVSGSSIFGITLWHGLKSFRWRAFRNMFLVWIITVPVTASLAGLTYLVLAKFF